MMMMKRKRQEGDSSREKRVSLPLERDENLFPSLVWFQGKSTCCSETIIIVVMIQPLVHLECSSIPLSWCWRQDRRRSYCRFWLQLLLLQLQLFLKQMWKKLERDSGYKKTLNGLLASQSEFEVHTAYRFKVSLLPASSSRITSNLTFARLLLL